MKIQVEIEIEPFSVPDFVNRKTVVPDGDQTGQIREMAGTPLQIPLCKVGDEILTQMCDEFKAAVFEKAREQAEAGAKEIGEEKDRI